MAAKILMTGSIMMDLILQMPRIPHPSESLLGTSYSNAGGGKGSNSAVAAWQSWRRSFCLWLHSVKIPTVKHFLACLLT